MSIWLTLLIAFISFFAGGAIFFFRQKEIDRSKLCQLQEEENALFLKVSSLADQKSNLEFAVEELRKVHQQQLSDGLWNITQHLDAEKKLAQDQLISWQKDCEAVYLGMLADSAQSFAEQAKQRKIAIAEAEARLDELHALVDAAIEANKREIAKEQEQNFYRLNISEKDLEEIKQLRLVADLLRDKEPLNKVIWKVYYEKPTTDLVGRVIGPGVHTGIYKITNLQNQMCYVGQAANLSDRWKQHIKRGLGAETPTKNKLYPIMQSVGVENFSFEVIEECDRSKLNEREDYWQEYFHAIDFGYSIK